MEDKGEKCTPKDRIVVEGRAGGGKRVRWVRGRQTTGGERG